MTTTQSEEKIKIALAIYRGLPDLERHNRLEEIRFKAAKHPTPEIQAFARKILPAVEQAESEIQRERRAIVEQAQRDALKTVQTRTIYVQTGYSSPDDERRTWEIRRGLLAFVGVAIVGAGIVSSVMWVINSGIMPYLLGTAFVLFCIGFMINGSGRQDRAATPGGSTTTNTQTIVFNVSQNGNVSYEQTTQAQK